MEYYFKGRKIFIINENNLMNLFKTTWTTEALPVSKPLAV